MNERHEMASVSSDFERFLKANFPDDYRKVIDPDVKEDVINAIMSRRADDYKIWCKIPEWIKNEYADNLPDEVLNGNKTVIQFINEEEKHNKIQEEENKKLMNYSVSLLAAGYAVETVSMMAQNRSLREELLLLAGVGPLTPEMKEKWRATRESDRHLILKDWKENQPEKYFMHVVKEMHRANRRKERADTPALMAAADMRLSSLEREFKEISERIKDENVRTRLMEYLREPSQQAALGRLRGDVLDKVTETLGNVGVRVVPKERSTSRTRGRRKTLASEIKSQIEDGNVDERVKAKVEQYSKASDEFVKPVKTIARDIVRQLNVELSR